jgi:hypothetical protein
MSTDLVPSSLTRERKTIMVHGEEFYELHCVNACGKTGGLVSKSSTDALGDFAYYICDDCAPTWGRFDRTQVLIPIEVVWQKARDAMLEKEGRVLSRLELVQAFSDPGHYLTKILRDQPKPR